MNGKKMRPEIEAAMKFVKNHAGQVVLFDCLDDGDKFSFVVVKTIMYFGRFVKGSNLMERAIRNAEAHRENGYESWEGKTMAIAREG